MKYSKVFECYVLYRITDKINTFCENGLRVTIHKNHIRNCARSLYVKKETDNLVHQIGAIFYKQLSVASYKHEYFFYSRL